MSLKTFVKCQYCGSKFFRFGLDSKCENCGAQFKEKDFYEHYYE